MRVGNVLKCICSKYPEGNRVRILVLANETALVAGEEFGSCWVNQADLFAQDLPKIEENIGKTVKFLNGVC